MKIRMNIKIATCFLSLFMVLASCSKKDDPTPPTPPEKALAPAKTYVGALLTDIDFGGFKSSTATDGITTVTILLGDETYTLSNETPLRVGESLELTDGSLTANISVDDTGLKPQFEFTLTGHSTVKFDFYESESNSIRVFSGTRKYIATAGGVTDGDVTDGDVTDGDVTDGDVTDGDVTDGDVTDGDVTDGDVTDGDDQLLESYVTTILLNKNGEWKSIDRVIYFGQDELFNINPGDFIEESGTYTETETGIEIKTPVPDVAPYTLNKEGENLELMVTNEFSVTTEIIYNKLAL